jgi:hypothetical protein
VSALVVETLLPRWLRVGKITAVFIAIGPLMASVLLFIGHLIEGYWNPHDALSLSQWPAVWLSWIMAAYLVGTPYALLTGGAYAALAVFAGACQFWVAIAAALAPLPFVHLLPAVGEPFWKWEAFFVWSTLVLATVPTWVCWYLSRRWHGHSP